MFVTAFGESFPVVGLLFPGTSVLIAAGALLAAGTLPTWPILIGAVLGAVLGDAVSYWLGGRFGHTIARMWPFTRHRSVATRPRFAQRHGGKSVFVGRFSAQSSRVPLAAGIMLMPPRRLLARQYRVGGIGRRCCCLPVTCQQGRRRLIGSANAVVLMFVMLTVLGIPPALPGRRCAQPRENLTWPSIAVPSQVCRSSPECGTRTTDLYEIFVRANLGSSPSRVWCCVSEYPLRSQQMLTPKGTRACDGDDVC
jgi:membrane protein YqaA with SNARE-associated domain